MSVILLVSAMTCENMQTKYNLLDPKTQKQPLKSIEYLLMKKN